MKVSELCRMIEGSIHAEKYPLEDQEQKNFAKLVKITNRSESDDLKSNDIKIEVRIQNLFVLNNYVPDIEHLPGIIEMDVLDSFKMLCRRAQRVSSDLITSI
ncbi:MAG: hypothetical protein QOK91_06640 [Nitrososphaeraceae archaeon]|nr:hypothetical protein [Nitrososphaeraceae archaeon]MDW0233184.1 hypothetical protein [Nitrososphaeraceae archaeon]